MKTFQDLERLSSEADRAKFCRTAVSEFKGTPQYAQALDGEAYYNKHNVTIERYQKLITSLSGIQRPDTFSANHKLKKLYFRNLVLQQVQYVLGNGLVLTDTANKAKLGKDFDFQLTFAAKRAMASGTAFGFWNVDHLEVFSLAETPSQPGFCPLYDEKTGQLRAGIRFWNRTIGDKTVFRCTLYEADGYTEYRGDNKITYLLKDKQAYIRTLVTGADGSIEDYTDENYGVLPIVPLYANDSKESELVGIRESIDCYDLIRSGFANNIDDASEIYWVLKNTGGMDDVDLANFLFRIKSAKGVVLDGDQGVEADAHTINIPVEARRTLLEILRADIYEDFQALDVKTLSAAAKTTQEIQAAYQAQDNKCADFEYFVLDFVQKILEIAEITDEPKFNWNKVVNQAEMTSMILQAAPYLTDEMIIKKLPFLTPEEAAEVIENRDKEDMTQFGAFEE